MSQLYLFARIGGADVAVRTEEIEAVVKLTDISPVPGVPPHVAGLSALRSRVLTIINTAALVQGRHAAAQPDSYAIITNLAGTSYGLLFDSVRDIAPGPGGEVWWRGQFVPAWGHMTGK